MTATSSRLPAKFLSHEVYMKKLSLCLLFTACLAGHSLAALDFFNYGAGLGQGNLLINAGIGFGTPLFGDTVVPPLSASVDYLYPLNGMPLSFGGLIGLTTSELDFSYGNYGYTYSYSMFTLGARMGWHFDFGVDKLDTYGTLTLGYIFTSAKAEYTGDWGAFPKTDPVATGSFLFGINVGARYFFTDMIGAYAEVGFSAFSFLSLGVAVKLGKSSGAPQRAASSSAASNSAVDSKLVGTWRITGTTTATILQFKADGTGTMTLQGVTSWTLPFILGKKSNTFTVKGASRDVEQTYRIEDDGNKLVMPKFLGEDYDGFLYNINPPNPISLVGTKWAGQTTLGEMTFEFKDESTCHQYAEKMNNKDNPSVASYTLKGNEVTYILGEDESVFFIEGNLFVIGTAVYEKQP
jgi:hypothetical protein